VGEKGKGGEGNRCAVGEKFSGCDLKKRGQLGKKKTKKTPNCGQLARETNKFDESLRRRGNSKYEDFPGWDGAVTEGEKREK